MSFDEIHLLLEEESIQIEEENQYEHFESINITTPMKNIKPTSPQSLHYSPFQPQLNNINESNINMIYSQEITPNYTQTTPTIDKRISPESSKSSSLYSIFPNSQSDSSYTWGSMSPFISKELLFEEEEKEEEKEEEEIEMFDNNNNEEIKNENDDDDENAINIMKNINNSSPQSVHEIDNIRIENNYNKENINNKNQIKSNLPNLRKHLNFLSKLGEIHYSLHKQNDDIVYIQSQFNRKITQLQQNSESKDKYLLFKSLNS